jgi:hypothetical protein
VSVFSVVKNCNVIEQISFYEHKIHIDSFTSLRFPSTVTERHPRPRTYWPRHRTSSTCLDVQNSKRKIVGPVIHPEGTACLCFVPYNSKPQYILEELIPDFHTIITSKLSTCLYRQHYLLVLPTSHCSNGRRAQQKISNNIVTNILTCPFIFVI